MTLQDILDARPTTAIVLGSGLGEVADAFEPIGHVSYADVPGLPVSKVTGHAGRFVLGSAGNHSVIIAQGRSHLYEGHSATDITAGIRFMASLGVKRIILTNAAGAINSQFAVGGLMLITDHLNLLGTTPLLGGPNFIDMTNVYDLRLRQHLHATATRLNFPLHEGVYAAVLGPQYETPAEIRMFRTLGADAVGMSTVPEAIQARALGLEVAGISMLTNWAAGLSPDTLHHSEVVEVGKASGGRLGLLLREALSD
ncbi:MAG: purine-nucleoside phosphorylase [Verrucomicrobiaceae bacterium]|nr:purine-nucleoside phosphorylase [Verrucomicrobiaceae bacterium]